MSIFMGTNPVPYWSNFCLYFFKCKYVQQLISKGQSRTYKIYWKSRFIDDLSTINNDVEFSSLYKYNYLEQLELKFENQEQHAKFLDLDITSEDNIFAYRVFDKRYKFFFFIVHILYSLSNISSSIFYGSIFSEFPRIA